MLVVDDDEKIAASVRRALVYDGYAVDVASDGVAALAHVRDEPPDLVILDVMLPGLDGLEVCRRLRADSTADLPILMLTARDATADRVRGLDMGADDYLVKPFAYDELLARVRALCGGVRKATRTTPPWTALICRSTSRATTFGAANARST